MGFRMAVLKGARWLVWLLLAWVLLRGVVSIVAPPPEAEAQRPAPPPVQIMTREPQAAFAALFVHEYLTWRSGAADDRADRLRPLLAAHLDRQAGWVGGDAAGSQRADGVWPYRIEEQGEGRWLVTVAAAVTATAGEEPPVSRTLYLAVPVAESSGGLLVYDYPAIVPPPEAAALEGPVLPGEEFSDPTGEIAELLAGFFRAYAAGGPADVRYYLEPGVALGGLGGLMAFDGLSGLTLYRVDDLTYASALVSLADPVTGTKSRQRYTVQVVQRDGRWYVTAIIQKGA